MYMDESNVDKGKWKMKKVERNLKVKKIITDVRIGNDVKVAQTHSFDLPMSTKL